MYEYSNIMEFKRYDWIINSNVKDSNIKDLEYDIHYETYQSSHLGLKGIIFYQTPKMFCRVIWLLKDWQLSNVQNPYDIPLYWLVYRDPYNGLC